MLTRKGQIQETVGALTQLQEKYRPTPWLSNTHAHLLYFDVIRKRQIQLEYDHFDQLEMQDGGVTGIMWFGYDLPEATPTVVVIRVGALHCAYAVDMQTFQCLYPK